MADKSTFIMLDRNILNWRWFKDTNTAMLFIYLLLKANIKDAGFENITIHRGQLATSYPSMAKDLGITERNARTALKHLKVTGEVTVKTYPKFSVITVVNYDKYQTKRQASCQSSDRQVTGKRQQSNNSNNGNKKINISPAQEKPFFDIKVWEDDQ